MHALGHAPAGASAVAEDVEVDSRDICSYGSGHGISVHSPQPEAGTKPVKDSFRAGPRKPESTLCSGEIPCPV